MKYRMGKKIFSRFWRTIMNNTVIKQDVTLVIMINDEKLMLISSLHQKL